MTESCVVCNLKAHFLCQTCDKKFCSQECSKKNILIGGLFEEDTPRLVIMEILKNIPFREIWRICSTNSRARSVCDDLGFRATYLIYRGREEVTNDMNYFLESNRIEFYIQWYQSTISSGMYDPAANNNSAVRWAVRNGHTDVLALLLQDDRVNPAANDNYAIRMATRNGHTEVVALLSQYRNKN